MQAHPAELTSATASGKAWAAERREERLAARCLSARRSLLYYRLRWQSWHELRGRTLKISGLPIPRSCQYASYLAVIWKKRAYLSRKSYEKWRSSYANLKDFRVCGNCNAWLRAVAEVQRPYPGTEGWLRSCSAPRSEGGYGRWVPNTQGSGAGGWLQFMESTFWRMYGAARYDVTSRGFRVPASANSWYSPLGQALAGAWAVKNGATGEWSGSGC